MRLICLFTYCNIAIFLSVIADVNKGVVYFCDPDGQVLLKIQPSELFLPWLPVCQFKSFERHNEITLRYRTRILCTYIK